MTSCAAMLITFGAILLGIPISIGIGYLISSMVKSLYSKMKNVTLPKVKIKLPEYRIPQPAFVAIPIIAIIICLIAFVPYGRTKPCDPVQTAKNIIQTKTLADCGCDEKTITINTLK